MKSLRTSLYRLKSIFIFCLQIFIKSKYLVFLIYCLLYYLPMVMSSFISLNRTFCITKFPCIFYVIWKMLCEGSQTYFKCLTMKCPFWGYLSLEKTKFNGVGSFSSVQCTTAQMSRPIFFFKFPLWACFYPSSKGLKIVKCWCGNPRWSSCCVGLDPSFSFFLSVFC